MLRPFQGLSLIFVLMLPVAVSACGPEYGMETEVGPPDETTIAPPSPVVAPGELTPGAAATPLLVEDLRAFMADPRWIPAAGGLELAPFVERDPDACVRASANALPLVVKNGVATRDGALDVRPCAAERGHSLEARMHAEVRCDGGVLDTANGAPLCDGAITAFVRSQVAITETVRSDASGLPDGRTSERQIRTVAATMGQTGDASWCRYDKKDGAWVKTACIDVAKTTVTRSRSIAGGQLVRGADEGTEDFLRLAITGDQVAIVRNDWQGTAELDTGAWQMHSGARTETGSLP